MTVQLYQFYTRKYVTLWYSCTVHFNEGWVNDQRMMMQLVCGKELTRGSLITPFAPTTHAVPGKEPHEAHSDQTHRAR